MDQTSNLSEYSVLKGIPAVTPEFFTTRSDTFCIHKQDNLRKVQKVGQTVCRLAMNRAQSRFCQLKILPGP